jgi:hypothetical protein
MKILIDFRSSRCTTSISDTGGHIFPEIYFDSGDTGRKFSTPVSTTLVTNEGYLILSKQRNKTFCLNHSRLPSVSLRPEVHLVNYEYLQEFRKKFKMA